MLGWVDGRTNGRMDGWTDPAVQVLDLGVLRQDLAATLGVRLLHAGWKNETKWMAMRRVGWVVWGKVGRAGRSGVQWSEKGVFTSETTVAIDDGVGMRNRLREGRGEGVVHEMGRRDETRGMVRWRWVRR